ncbi:MAG: sugar-binding domain-containing protein [Bacteroidota bacterium]
MRPFVVLCCFLTTSFLTGQSQKEITNVRTKLDINANWRFVKGEQSEAVTKADFDDSAWEQVNIPHTMELVSNDIFALGDEPTQEFFQRFIGYYRKELTVDAKAGQKVFLEFEGAHQVTKCWVNGQYVGENNLGGYTPFHFDITAFLRPNGQKNVVVLSVDKRKNLTIPPDGGQMDYLLFSGIYRDVYLVVTNPVHVTFNWDAQNSRGRFTGIRLVP